MNRDLVVYVGLCRDVITDRRHGIHPVAVDPLLRCDRPLLASGQETQHQHTDRHTNMDLCGWSQVRGQTLVPDLGQQVLLSLQLLLGVLHSTLHGQTGTELSAVHAQHRHVETTGTNPTSGRQERFISINYNSNITTSLSIMTLYSLCSNMFSTCRRSLGVAWL